MAFLFIKVFLLCSVYLSSLQRALHYFKKTHLPSSFNYIQAFERYGFREKKWILCYTWRYLDTYLRTQALSSIFFIFLPGYIKYHNDLHRLLEMKTLMLLEESLCLNYEYLLSICAPYRCLCYMRWINHNSLLIYSFSLYCIG